MQKAALSRLMDGAAFRISNYCSYGIIQANLEILDFLEVLRILQIPVCQ